MNPPKRWHARLNTDLLLALAPLARRVGLEPFGDSTGVFADVERDWRVPDQAYARPEQGIDEGLVGAELVVEIRSPGDESHDKLLFYAARSITEVLIVDEDRGFELYRLGPDGRYARVEGPSATATSAVLGVTFSTAGDRLRIGWEGGSTDV